MSLMDFVVSPPGCGRSVNDFWGSDAHQALLRCPDEVDGDIWIWSAGRGLNLISTKLPKPWSPWESSPSRKNPHGKTGTRIRELMISSQKLWPLDHGGSQFCDYNRQDTDRIHLPQLWGSSIIHVEEFLQVSIQRNNVQVIQSFSSLSHDRSKASTNSSSPRGVI
jgi:hypothetical protein